MNKQEQQVAVDLYFDWYKRKHPKATDETVMYWTKKEDLALFLRDLKKSLKMGLNL